MSAQLTSFVRPTKTPEVPWYVPRAKTTLSPSRNIVLPGVLLIMFGKSFIRRVFDDPWALLAKLRLVHEPGLFQPGLLCFLLVGYPRGISLRGFLIVEPLRFVDGCLSGPFQSL